MNPEEHDERIAWLEEKRLQALDHLEALQQDVAHAEAVLEMCASAVAEAYQAKRREHYPL